jgi:hypothetical protein
MSNNVIPAKTMVSITGLTDCNASLQVPRELDGNSIAASELPAESLNWGLLP